MKRILITLAAAALCLPAAAQHFDPEHRHAIEISSGLPPIHTFMLGIGNEHRMMTGLHEHHNLRIALNLGYTYTINEKWDFNFLVDIAQDYYTHTRYPMKQEATQEHPYPLFDTSAEPTEVKHGVNLWPSYTADFRWKWYRTDTTRFYSAFGLSYLPFVWPIFPYLTPIGISVGHRQGVYGFAELNLSTASTFLLVGAGYRF